jgi:hypothetical protein
MAVAVAALIEMMERDAVFSRIINNPLAQFGTDSSPLLGAEILPEEIREENSYTETGITYRTLVANDGTRFGPVQKKGGVMSGSFDVALSHQDIGSEFSAQDFDRFLHLLRQADSVADSFGMEALASLTAFFDRTINLPLRHKIEVMRWQAIVDAQVVRVGSNGFEETIAYSNPSGHRVVSGDWTNASVDAYEEIMNMADTLAGKGYRVARIYMGTQALSRLSANVKMRSRVGLASVVSGTVTGLAGRATLAQINATLQDDGLPPITRYDAQYHTESSSDFFLDRGAMVFVCATPREHTITAPEATNLVLPNTIGYAGIGRPAGAQSAGRLAFLNPHLRTKPPHLAAEGWQTSLPVITAPEAIGVIKDIV